MKNIATKSVNLSDIMVYLAMFSTISDRILCFLGPQQMKMSNYFSVSDPKTVHTLRETNYMCEDCEVIERMNLQ